MEISFRAIQDNILKVVCSEQKTDTVPGEQILPEADAQTAAAGLITAAVKDSAVTFSRADQEFAVQSGCALTPKEVFRYTFTGSAPVIVTKKTIDGERSFVENADTVKIADAYEAEISFRLSDGEAIYGLGQQENGYYNYRGVKEYLYQNNMKIPMPVVLSSKNYALLFDASCMFSYEEHDNTMTFDFDAVDALVYYVITGNRHPYIHSLVFRSAAF